MLSVVFFSLLNATGFQIPLYMRFGVNICQAMILKKKKKKIVIKDIFIATHTKIVEEIRTLKSS